MQVILIILLKVLLSSGLLFGYYWLFLRDKSFHQYNRYFLLATAVISLVIPFVNIPFIGISGSRVGQAMYKTLEVITVYSEGEEVEVGASAGKPALGIFWGIYLLGMMTALAVLVHSFIIIRRMANRYESEKIDDIYIYHTNEDGTPFSYFRKLFWNDRILLHSREGQQIFRHELYHIRQGHSLDILFMRLVQVVFWFNPFYQLIINELKTIHEFLADRHAIAEHDHLEYAEVLLEQSIKARQLQLSNHFFQHQIKRRITMITNLQFRNPGYFSRLLALPVAVTLCLTLVSFAFKHQQNIEAVAASEKVTIVLDAGHGGIDPGARSKDGSISEQELALDIVQKVKALSAAYNIEVELTRTGETLPGGLTDPSAANRWRLDFVRTVKPMMFVSLHINAANNEERKGLEIYVPANTGKNRFKEDSRIAASIMAAELGEFFPDIKVLQNGSRGIYVLDFNDVPAIMIHPGFITNSEDLAFLRQEANQEKIARKILEGVVAFHQNRKSNGSLMEAGWNSPASGKEINGLTYDSIGYAVSRHFARNLRYPEISRINDQEGMVAATVLLHPDGKFKKIIFQDRPFPQGEAVNIDVASYPRGDVSGQQVAATVKSPLQSEVERAAWHFRPAGSFPLQYNVNIRFRLDESKVLPIKKSSAGPNPAGQTAEDRSMSELSSRSQLDALAGAQTSPNQGLNLSQAQVKPSYPGGAESWQQFLNKTLHYPQEAIDKEIMGTVLVQFIIHADGTTSDFKALTDPGGGLADEAIRVFKASGRWNPAILNGKKVKAIHKHPITFRLEIQ